VAGIDYIDIYVLSTLLRQIWFIEKHPSCSHATCIIIAVDSIDTCQIEILSFPLFALDFSRVDHHSLSMDGKHRWWSPRHEIEGCALVGRGVIYTQWVLYTVCFLSTDHLLSEEWKARDVISSHIDFPAPMLNWSFWGIHNWSWFYQSLFLLFFTLKREKSYLFVHSTLFSFIFKRQVLMGKPVAV